MTIPDYSAHNREKQQHEFRLREARTLSEIRLQEEQKRKEIELQARGVEYKQDQDKIDRAALSPALLEQQERQQLFEMYDQRVHLQNSNDPAKDHKLKALNKAIKKKEAKLFEQ
jgi:hypothetical protein